VNVGDEDDDPAAVRWRGIAAVCDTGEHVLDGVPEAGPAEGLPQHRRL
jgi:hypothetical protein